MAKNGARLLIHRELLGTGGAGGSEHYLSASGPVCFIRANTEAGVKGTGAPFRFGVEKGHVTNSGSTANSILVASNSVLELRDIHLRATVFFCLATGLNDRYINLAYALV